MTTRTADTVDRAAVLERLGREHRIPGMPSTEEVVRRLLERGSRPVTASDIQRMARRLRPNTPPRVSEPPKPRADGYPGAAFIDPAPGFRNRPSAGGPETADPCAPDVLRRLVDRTTFGFSWTELDDAYTNGYDAFLERQLDYESIDDAELEDRLATEFETLNESPRRHVLRAVSGDLTMTFELLFATILRQATSRRQLYERMVEFWSDHLNIYLFKDGSEMFKPIDDRDVIRPHAMGRFSDLLKASAKSPAMLTYLDGAFSFAWSPNQNYARELMELHTIGPDGFSQTDMEQVARCFTGWTIDYDINSRTLGEFRFESYWHDYGTKNVLGQKIPNGGGVTDGERVIDILCHAPEVAPLTARFLARKLAVRFWGEDPPEGLVEETAQAYLDTGGEIRAMLRVVLSQRWMACSRPRLKRPYHLALSVLRAMPSDIQGYWSLIYLLDVMGQIPFLWAPPNGYPDAGAFWSGHILPRWRYGYSLIHEQNEVQIDYTPFFRNDPEEVVDTIDVYLFGGTLGRAERAELLEYLGEPPLVTIRILETIGLAIAGPAFQQH